MRTFVGAAAVLTALSLPAQAGTATGKVAALQVDGSHVIVSVAGPVASRATCNVGNGFAADAGSALGQAVNQTATAVQGTEFKVTVVGSGSCTVTPGFEDVVSLGVTTNR